jgi:hypothetical protein
MVPASRCWERDAASSARWTAVSPGLEINADQGGALRLHIQNMNLPEGVEMYVYSRSGEVRSVHVGR